MGFVLRITSDQNLVSTDDSPLREQIKLVDIQPGWHDFVFKIKWSYFEDGRIEVWYKKKSVLEYSYIVDKHGPNMHNDKKRGYIKWGIYKPAWLNGSTATYRRVVFHDNVIIGNNFTDIVPDFPIFIDKSHLHFGATLNGLSTKPRNFFLDNSSGTKLGWTISSDVSWVSCVPISGIGSEKVTVSVEPKNLAIGTYRGTITISDSDKTNSPKTVAVTLNVYNPNQTSSPFGEFATPVNNTSVSGSIPITGWALDDIGVESVRISRGLIGNLTYIGDAVFVEGARPDIEASYSEYPMNYQAGWGYMLLTNFLPPDGNGIFTLHAIATDIEGNETTLDSKIIIVDNATAVKPFGAIDTPVQGGIASGSNFNNIGWVLTPQPNEIATDGSTIDVYIDSKKIGNVKYNQYRSEIAEYFPGYTNTYGSMATFSLDTTAYENGIHTIFWIAKDNAGNSDGIGSRFFSIQNASNSRIGNNMSSTNNRQSLGRMSRTESMGEEKYIQFEYKTNFDSGNQYCPLFTDENGRDVIIITELKPVEIKSEERIHIVDGYLKSGENYRPLPIGSSIEDGIFHWIPGPGFLGDYDLVFVGKDNDGASITKSLRIRIQPKFEELGKI